MNNFFKKWLIGVGVVFLLSLIVIMITVTEARQARFTVDVLEQYLEAYQLVEHRSIESLSQLPDFDLVSPAESLSLKSQDLKQGIHGGYIYDFQYLGNGKFVISASPVGLLPIWEFGITNSGNLRMNTRNVDAQADSYEEVEGWRLIPRKDKARSKDLPGYLQ